MTKQLTFLLFIGFVFQVQAQITRLSIVGKVSNDYVSVESIHILNKSTKKGTISNTYGMFEIPVKENDTLVFRGIQFKKKEIVITQQVLKSKILKVALVQNTTQLDVVEIKNYNLSGDLFTDAKNEKLSKSRLNPSAFNLGKIDFKVVDDIDATDRLKAPDPFTGTSAQFNRGIDILYLINPIVKGLSKIGERRRNRKKAEKVLKIKISATPDKVKEELGDTFFIETLKIPQDQIDAFLTYCKSKNLMILYLKDKKIEFIEALMKEHQNFKAFIKTQN